MTQTSRQGQSPSPAVNQPTPGALPDLTRPPPRATGGAPVSGGQQLNAGTPNLPPQYFWTRDGKPICIACGQVGHLRRNCRVRQEN